MVISPTKTIKEPKVSEDSAKKPTISKPLKHTIKQAVSKSPKRKRTEIRNLIVASLRNYPKSTHGIATDTSMRFETSLANLKALEKMKVVERINADFSKKRKCNYWRLKNER